MIKIIFPIHCLAYYLNELQEKVILKKKKGPVGPLLLGNQTEELFFMQENV